MRSIDRTECMAHRVAGSCQQEATLVLLNHIDVGGE